MTKPDENSRNYRAKAQLEKAASGHKVSLPRVLAVSALGYALVAGVKFYLAHVSYSIALRADAWHSIADLFAVLSALAALYVSERKSERFPRGLYKVENLASLLISLLIFYAGYNIIREAFFTHHGEHHELAHLPFAIGGLLVTIGVVAYLAYHKVHAGRETGSPSTTAAGYHSMVAVFASLAVLVGLIGSIFNTEVDNITAGVVTALLAWAGIRIAVNSLKVLLEASLDPHDLHRIEELLQTVPGVTEVVSVSGREAGRYKFIEITVGLRTRDLEHANYVCKKIENRVKEEISNVDHVDIIYIPGSRARKALDSAGAPFGDATTGNNKV